MALGGALAQAFVRLRVDSSQVAADTSKGIKEGAATGDAEAAGANAGDSFSKGFNKAFKVAAVAGLAIAAIGAASIKSGIEFQSTMTRIQTQAGASKSQVAQLSGEVLKLAPSTQQGPQQLAEALYHLKSVGLDNVDAMKALKVASDLAAVGGANLEDTTNAIAAAWRSGIKGASDFGTAAATVNAIIGAGNMKMQDFVASLSSGILPAAKTFGVSLTSVGSAMALMTDEGIPAQLAATRLRMSLSLLGAPSQVASKYLKQIGLTSLDLGQAMRGPQGIIGAIGLLKSHLDASGLSATQSANLLSRAFGGGQSSSAILTLINNFDTLKKKQDQIAGSIGKYGPAVAAQRQTVQAQLDILRSSLQTIGVRMGLALLPPFVKLVRFLSSDVIPAALKLGGVLGGLFRNPVAGAFLGALLAAVVAIKAIIVVTKLAAAAQLLWDAAFAASGIGTVIVLVAALAAGIAILWERSSTFRNVVEGAFHAVLSVVEATWNWIKGHWELLGAILLGPVAPVLLLVAAFSKLLGPAEHAFDAIKNAVTGGFDSWWASHGKQIEQVWSAVWKAVSGVVKTLWAPTVAVIKAGVTAVEAVFKAMMTVASAIFRAGWGAISASARAVWDVISGVVKAAWAVISGAVKIGIAGIESVIKIAWDVIVGIFTVALDLLTGKWGKAWHDAQTTVTQVWNAIKGFLSATWNDIKQTAAAAWNALIGGVKSMGSDLLGYFRRLPGMILAALGNVGRLLWNAGVSIIKGLIGGIGSMIGAVGHAIGSVVSEIKNFLPFSPAKKGPLSGKGDPFYSGLSIGKKVAAGIKAALPALKSAVTGSVAQINSALAKAGSEKKTGTKQLGKLTSTQKHLQAERTKEENQIHKLVAERAAEYAKDGKASKALRAEQEKQIKSLERLRAAQETQVKQTEAVIKNLRHELSQLKSETSKLTAALKKATKASSSSSSSGSSSGSSGSGAAATPNWVALSQWLTDTSGAVTPASGGSWQGNPGPLGGFGLGMGAGPRPVGRWRGPLGGQGDDMMWPLLLGKLDELVGVAREQPARTAAGLNAALNGVASKAVVRGNW